MPQQLEPKEAARRAKTLGRNLLGAIAKPMNRKRNEAAKVARQDFKTRDPGKSIFASRGRPKTGVPPLIIRGRGARLSKTEGAFLVSIFVLGMAALIEEGGRTKAHTIKPVRGRLLRFETATGNVFTRGPVRHPGSQIPKNAIAKRAVERTFRSLPPEIDRELVELVKRSGLD